MHTFTCVHSYARRARPRPPDRMAAGDVAAERAAALQPLTTPYNPLQPLTLTTGEQPVFLDARRPGSDNCCLFVLQADGVTRRDLSAKPFAATPALYLAGGDFFARKLLLDRPADAERFHLIDAPKSAASA